MPKTPLGSWACSRNRPEPTGVEFYVTNFLSLPNPLWGPVSKGSALLAEDETPEGSHPPVMKYRRPGPKHLVYSIPPFEWSRVLQRVMEQKEPLRTVAAAYGVSHETIRRIVLHVQKERGQQEA